MATEEQINTVMIVTYFVWGTVILLLVAVAAVVAKVFPVVLGEFEAIAVRRFGKITSVIVGPGLHFVACIDEFVSFDWNVAEVNDSGESARTRIRGNRIPFRVPLIYDMPAVDCMTSNNVQLKPDVAVHYQIMDALLAIRSRNPLRVMYMTLQRHLQHEISQRALEEFTKTTSIPGLEVILAHVCQRSLEKETGISIIRVRVQSMGLPASVTAAHEAKMIALTSQEREKDRLKHDSEMRRAREEASKESLSVKAAVDMHVLETRMARAADIAKKVGESSGLFGTDATQADFKSRFMANAAYWFTANRACGCPHYASVRPAPPPPGVT